jgi:hypothetical protein
MEQPELLRYVCTVCERLGIKYLVTGSQATIAFGEPRFTNDIDIVAGIGAAELEAFCSAFPDDEFYLSRTAAREAVAQHRMFNIIHPASGLKVDVIIPAATASERSRFDRGVRVRVAEDFEATFASPEDVILKKLEFFKIGGSDRHLRDIAGVLKVRGPAVDRAYITRFAAQLGVADIWQAVRREVDGPQPDG